MSILRDYSRLNQFLNDRELDIGAAFFDWAHSELSLQTLEALVALLPPGGKVLDIGCGTGRDLIRFKNRGLTPVGISMNLEDKLLKSRIAEFDLDVRMMDQHFLDFEPEEFDGIFARHVLEHSVIPYFALTEYNRVLKPHGHIYVEVPAPDWRRHEYNDNHYSVLGRKMWESLFYRSGFTLTSSIDFNFGDQEQDNKPVDLWMGFFLTKVSEPRKSKVREDHGVESYWENPYGMEEQF